MHDVLGVGEKLTIGIAGMACDGCVQVLENAVNRLPGIAYVGVSLSGASMTVRSGEGFDLANLFGCVKALGYEVSEAGKAFPGTSMDCPCRARARAR